MRQQPEELLDVVTGLRRLMVDRREYHVVIEGIMDRLTALAAAMQVSELVAGDCLDPGCQRLRRIIRMTLIVNGQEQLLQKILDLVGQASKPSAQVGA